MYKIKVPLNTFKHVNIIIKHTYYVYVTPNYSRRFKLNTSQFFVTVVASPTVDGAFLNAQQVHCLSLSLGSGRNLFAWANTWIGSGSRSGSMPNEPLWKAKVERNPKVAREEGGQGNASGEVGSGSVNGAHCALWANLTGE